MILHHKQQEEPKCGVDSCSGDAVRSLPTKKVMSALPELKLKDETKKRTQLCKEHYKSFKKKTKKEKELESLAW